MKANETMVHQVLIRYTLITEGCSQTEYVGGLITDTELARIVAAKEDGHKYREMVKAVKAFLPEDRADEIFNIAIFPMPAMSDAFGFDFYRG